jgi:hypothetical protein
MTKNKVCANTVISVSVIVAVVDDDDDEGILFWFSFLHALNL